MRKLLLNAAVGAVAVGVLESKTHFGMIFFQIEELLAVKCSTALSEIKINIYLKRSNPDDYYYYIIFRSITLTHCRMN